ncbi:hypothetical protein [Bosea vaviloviae]|nr:hypothetical protein [Bosea vaviloviae]
MNYPNGQKVLIGDEVALAGSNGLVVAAIEEAAYSHRSSSETSV